MDQTQGGFAVATTESLAIAVNQACRLWTSQGWCDVRVARVEHFQDGMLLGLFVLRECATPKERWLRFLARWSLGRLAVRR